MSGEDRIKSKLYAVVETGAAAVERLSAALGGGNIAAVLIRPAGGTPLTAQLVQPLVKAAQDKGAAALLENDAELVRVVKADGVHLAPRETIVADYEEARSILGNRYIIGADPGTVRDDAMTLAELGADYVAFSIAGAGSLDERSELSAWWAEIFQVPCVALDVTDADDAIALQRSNADFLGLTLPGTEAPAASAERAKTIAAALVADYAQARA